MIHIIFVQGLDNGGPVKNRLLQQWTKHEVAISSFVPDWKNNEPYQPKLTRLLTEIDRATARGSEVALIGISAGGSLALNALLQRPNLLAVINICGRVRAGRGVFPSLRLVSRTNKAFAESVAALEAEQPRLTPHSRNQVLNMRPLFDELVPRTTSHIEGATTFSSLSVEHNLSWLLALTLHRKRIMRYLYDRST